MADWLRLDTDRLRRIESGYDPIDREHGTVVRVTTSPHAIPLAIRGFATEDNGFRIEFRYVDTERAITRTLRDGVIVSHGKHSQRIMAIEMPEETLDDGHITLEVKVANLTREIAQELQIEQQDRFIQDNFQSTQTAIDQVANRIFSTTPTPSEHEITG